MEGQNHPQGPILRPQQGPPFWVQMLVKSRLWQCPAGCQTTNLVGSYPEAWNLHQVQPLTAPGKGTAYGRCLRCMTYWEVNHKGEVAKLKWGEDVPDWVKNEWRAKNSTLTGEG